MKNIRVDWAIVGWLFQCVFLFTPQTLWAQAYKPETYRVLVVTDTHKHIRGTLSGVDASSLVVLDKFYDTQAIPLEAVRKVSVYKYAPRSRIITGTIVGGLTVGYIANWALQREGPRSPVLYGLTLSLAALSGAAAGTILGKYVSGTSIGQKRLIVRAKGDSESMAHLQHVLEPLSENYQDNIIKRTP